MPSDPATEDLVNKARNGERCAFDELVRGLSKDLRAFVGSRLGRSLRQQMEPEDIVQDALLKAFERFHHFEWRGPGSLERWLFAIAEHLIRNASRKRSVATEQISLERRSTQPSPSRVLRREERFDRLEDALRSLSPDHRMVIKLARIEGLKIREIAERMHRSPGAVKQLLSRALESLRGRIGDTESLSLPDQSIDLGDSNDG